MREMPFEEYIAGVVAGEIKNDWPLEAIKAQAIIARTFVLQFISEKGRSKYENAHVSTDIEEAQAWNAGAVNDRIKRRWKNQRPGNCIPGHLAAPGFIPMQAAKPLPRRAELRDEPPPYIQVVDSRTPMVEADAKTDGCFPRTSIKAMEAGKPIKTLTAFP